MALSVRDYTIIKVVQATHHQGNVKYGISRGIQYSCMSLMSINWTLFRSPGLWDKFDFDWILGKGDQLFKFMGKFRYLGMEDLPQEFLVENSSINMEFLESNSWGMLDIYLRNCKRCSANWSWCLTYSQQLYSRPNLGI